MRVGILGGTFDPVHQGHLAIAQAAREQFQLSQVLFIPVRIPPHKSLEALTPALDRFRMLECAVEGLSPEFQLSDIEIARPEISFTVDTLRILQAEDPRRELYLIVGSDTFQGFSEWKDPEAILRLAHILIAPRPGFPVAREERKGISRIRMPEVTASSTEIRERLRKTLPLGPGLLPSRVEAYIRRHRLYQNQEKPA